MPLPALSDHSEGVWSLPELVALANDLLPSYLPKEASGRVVEQVNARLVRHYTTQGLLPEPRKDGRAARYLYEHLLSLLVVRRLLAEGYSSTGIKRLLNGADEGGLRRLLEGGVEIRLVPTDQGTGVEERQSFVASVRARAGLPTAASPLVTAPQGRASSAMQVTAIPPAPSAAPSRLAPTMRAAVSQPDISNVFNETRWTSYSVADGLELFVRDDFSLPATRLGDEQLLQLLKALLIDLEQKQRSRTNH